MSPSAIAYLVIRFVPPILALVAVLVAPAPARQPAFALLVALIVASIVVGLFWPAPRGGATPSRGRPRVTRLQIAVGAVIMVTVAGCLTWLGLAVGGWGLVVFSSLALAVIVVPGMGFALFLRMPPRS